MTDVALKDIPVSPSEFLTTIERPVSSFPNTVGIRVMNEDVFKHRFDDIAKGMVHHPIAERGCGDEAPFRFMDMETCIGAGAIPLFEQLTPQGIKIILKTVFEQRHIRAPSFPFTCQTVSKQKIIP